MLQRNVEALVKRMGLQKKLKEKKKNKWNHGIWNNIFIYALFPFIPLVNIQYSGKMHDFISDR